MYTLFRVITKHLVLAKFTKQLPVGFLSGDCLVRHWTLLWLHTCNYSPSLSHFTWNFRWVSNFLNVTPTVRDSVESFWGMFWPGSSNIWVCCSWSVLCWNDCLNKIKKQNDYLVMKMQNSFNHIINQKWKKKNVFFFSRNS